MSLVKALSSMFVVLGLGLAGAAPAQAASTWSTPVEPPSGCSSSIIAANTAGAVVTAGYFQSGTGLEAFSVEVHPAHAALNSAGDASFIWETDTSIFVSTRTPAGAWAAPTQLASVPGEVGTAIDGAGNAIAAFSIDQGGAVPTYASRRSAGGTWGTPTRVSASNDKGLGNVAGDAAGTFVIAWTNSAGAVEALTMPPGGSSGPGTAVGAGPFGALLVLPGEAVLSIGAGLSKETVQ